jgi:DNA polymerase-1
VRGASERNAGTTPIREADIIKIAMINIFKKFEELQCKSKCSFVSA